jgi:hypothetical protein
MAVQATASSYWSSQKAEPTEAGKQEWDGEAHISALECHAIL